MQKRFMLIDKFSAPCNPKIVLLAVPLKPDRNEHPDFIGIKWRAGLYLPSAIAADFQDKQSGLRYLQLTI
ncbi:MULTISPECIES: hypothetical protein [Pedobacter]|uniref:Uncharacterized protein n=1 Tax=Pedobacter zeae TaxID=1737356 RepID=A0A7W6K6W4_9SPHI|nr:hypothetical protein [Pedobacter zeae]MBB4106304.1 hypothetical protein [Pedobacter zeae]